MRDEFLNRWGADLTAFSKTIMSVELDALLKNAFMAGVKWEADLNKAAYDVRWENMAAERIRAREKYNGEW